MEPSFHLRDLRRDDLPDLAALHVQTFRETHGGGPGAALRLAQWTEQFENPPPGWFLLVVEDEAGQLVGFANGVPYYEGVYSGKLGKIYLLRAFHGRGLGRKLLCAVAKRFLAQGITSMLLFGEVRNP